MIVSVSGFGWSGSGAVLDLLREYSDLEVAFDGCNVDPEFILLADVDGIRDLEYHLMERNCRTSSYMAIQRYMDLVKAYNKYMNVNDVFEGKLVDITKKYLDGLVDFKLKSATYHEYYQTNPLFFKYNELVCHIFYNRITRFFLKDFYKKILYEKNTLMSVAYYPDDFQIKTKKYLNTLFDMLRKDKNKPIVFDQMLPPDAPVTFMKYIDEPRCIAVRRDPRDSYILAKRVYNSSIPIPVSSVNDFIVYYRKIVQNTYIFDNPAILNIQYEDLIYSYEETKNRIEKFLGISHHDYPKSKFNPAVSVNNTQLFKKYSGFEKDIKEIEAALPTSLFHFESKTQFEAEKCDVF